MNALAQPRRSMFRLSFVPLIVLMLAAVLANAGVAVTKDATAATDSVIVSATVSAVASTATNGCAADTMTITFTMATQSQGSCTITFGTNASGITLTVDDSTQADGFMTQGSNNFIDSNLADCSTFSGATDLVGYKIDTGGSATVNKCTANAAATNAQWSDIPTDVPAVVGADTACTTSAIGTQTCPIAVGMWESGSNAPAATYGGTITVTSS